MEFSVCTHLCPVPKWRRRCAWRHWSFSRLAVLVLLVTAPMPSTALADESSSSLQSGPRPYCGVYCAYAAMKTLQVDVEFESLLKTQYIGGRKGSTIPELQKALRDNGLHGVAAKSLSTADLGDLSVPAILHVKTSVESKIYDHFILYIGSRDGQAIILDPPMAATVVPFGELASIWGGTALAISKSPISVRSIQGRAWVRGILWASVCVVLVANVRCFPKRVKLVSCLANA